MDKALAMAGYADRVDEGRGEARGKFLGHGPVDLHRGLRRRARPSGSARSARAGAPRCGRSTNIRVHLTGKTVVTVGTQPQGQGHETTYAQVLATSWASRWTTSSSSTRTRWERRSATARTAPHLVGRHRRAIKAAGKIREKARSYAAHMLEAVTGRHRGRGRRVPRQGLARQDEDAPGDRLRARPRVRRAGGHGAVPRRDRLPRHAQLHVAVRDARRGGRDRPGDRATSSWCATSRSTTWARRSTR